MADASDVASTSGWISAIVAILVALADWIKRRNAAATAKKLENIAPSEMVSRTPREQTVIFDRSKDPYSPDLIARVETYVRAEGELRIQLAQKEWEYKQLVEHRDNLLRALHAAGEENEKLKSKNQALANELLDIRKQLGR